MTLPVTLLLITLGAILSMVSTYLAHRRRWRLPNTHQSGDYRVAPAEIEGAIVVPPVIKAVGLFAPLWALCTFVLAFAGALLLLLVVDRAHSGGFVLALVLIVLSALLHGGMLLFASSRLIRRHPRAYVASRRVALHGLLHHAAVFTLFAWWLQVDARPLMGLGHTAIAIPCLVGVAVSALLWRAAPHTLGAPPIEHGSDA